MKLNALSTPWTVNSLRTQYATGKTRLAGYERQQLNWIPIQMLTVNAHSEVKNRVKYEVSMMNLITSSSSLLSHKSVEFHHLMNSIDESLNRRSTVDHDRIAFDGNVRSKSPISRWYWTQQERSQCMRRSATCEKQCNSYCERSDIEAEEHAIEEELDENER